MSSCVSRQRMTMPYILRHKHKRSFELFFYHRAYCICICKSTSSITESSLIFHYSAYIPIIAWRSCDISCRVRSICNNAIAWVAKSTSREDCIKKYTSSWVWRRPSERIFLFFYVIRQIWCGNTEIWRTWIVNGFYCCIKSAKAWGCWIYACIIHIPII